MARKRFRNFLSEEIVDQILVKVQCTKTLLRCTAVCKSWYSLIKFSKFIYTHLSHPNNTKYLFCESDNSVYSDGEPAEERCTLVFPSTSRRLQRIKIHGCCNGVICYTGNRGIIHLWNPCIRKVKLLPSFRKTGRVKNAVAFWFNAEEHDYQVVRVAYTRKTSFVEVLSLSGNTWKMISETCPGALKISDKNIVYVNGTLHWLAEQERGLIIVSLDMNTAKFREKLISSPCLEATEFYLTHVYDDILSVLRIGSRWDSLVNENLAIFGISPVEIDADSGEVLLTLGFQKIVEFLVFKITDADEMVSYDSYIVQMKDPIVSGQNLTMGRPFVKSLVLLNDSDVQITDGPVSGKKFI